jgi:site-specific recombinase XerD
MRATMSAYIEALALSPSSVKQHLAALRGLFSWLVIRQVVPDNPAMFVKGPRFSRQIGITPILEGAQMRALLDSIKPTRMVRIPANHGGGEREEPDLKGLRDRAVIAIMAYTFARVSAVTRLKRGDYRLEGKRARLRLLEKAIRKSSSGSTMKRRNFWIRIWRSPESTARMRRCFRRWTKPTG